MATTRTLRSFLFLGILALTLLSSTLTVLAKDPVDSPRTDPAPNPIDDWFTEPEPGESTTCNRAPWGERTPKDMQCLELPNLVPSFW